MRKKLIQTLLYARDRIENLCNEHVGKLRRLLADGEDMTAEQIRDFYDLIEESIYRQVPTRYRKDDPRCYVDNYYTLNICEPDANNQRRWRQFFPEDQVADFIKSCMESNDPPLTVQFNVRFNLEFPVHPSKRGQDAWVVSRNEPLGDSTISIAFGFLEKREDQKVVRLYEVKDGSRIGAFRKAVAGPDDVKIDDPTISDVHAKFKERDGGEFFIEDVGSTNGTRVNGDAIGRNTETRVDYDYLLTFGDLDLYLVRSARFRAVLTPVSGNFRRQSFSITDKTPEVTIGRGGESSNSRFALPEMVPTMDEDHAVLNFVSGEGVWIRDCGTINGTFVNRKQLGSDERVLLRPNDGLNIGGIDFRYTEMPR